MIFGMELLIVVTVILFIGYPILKPAGLLEKQVEGDEHHDLLYKRDAIYASLKELEFDYKTGKIDEDDHANLKAGLEKDAVAILKNLDSLEKRERPQKQKKRDKKAKGKFCKECGEELSGGDKFCSSCGTATN